MRTALAFFVTAVVVVSAALCVGSALAAEECVVPQLQAELRATREQRNVALDQVASIIANATKQIEALTKERDELKAKAEKQK